MKICGIARLIFLIVLPAALVSVAMAWGPEGSFERTLAIHGRVNLEITNGSGSIHIHTADSNSVHISARIKANSMFDSDAEEEIKKIEANPPIVQSGNSIHIGRNDDPDLQHVSISYEITVPPQTELRSRTGSGSQEIEGLRQMATVTAGSGTLTLRNLAAGVHAETGSGSIVLQGIQGDVTAKTGSGSIHATEVAGSFDAHTGSGHIDFQQASSGSVRAQTGSGSMDLDGLRGSLMAESGSGSIHASGMPVGPWTLHAGSGSVRLQLAANASYDLHAHTGSGSISVDAPVTAKSSSKHDFTGKVRGGGVSVNVESGSGSVDVQ